MSTKRDLEFLYEIGCLRFISRTWVQMLGPKFANLAEHHLRVIWIALLLSKMEDAGNQEKIMKMALVHDVAESRTGDVHYISRLYTKRDESQAIKDILTDTSVEQEFVNLWHEYEKRDCIEAKIVKDADTLDVDIELHEQAANGVGLEEQWCNIRKDQVYPRLYTNSAKRLWEMIKDSNPHDWHRFAKNRHTAGDWSQPI